MALQAGRTIPILVYFTLACGLYFGVFILERSISHFPGVSEMRIHPRFVQKMIATSLFIVVYVEP